MLAGSIFTIGYGNRSVDEILRELHNHRVEYLIDVRTSPYSRFHPEYSRDALQRSVEQSGIRYVFLGKELGGRPVDESCYVDGKVDYKLVSEKDFYQSGLKRLVSAHEQGLCVCLLCSEAKPESCHRSKLIGESLSRLGITAEHIGPDGAVRTQEEVIAELTGGQLSMFDNQFTSVRRYRPQGKEDDVQK